MSERFYTQSVQGNAAVLFGDEAHHFVKVMRGKIGDTVQLFDGTGLLYRCTVTDIRKNEVAVNILETEPDTIESPVRLTVASALPKGDRQRFLVEKIAELGAARFVPMHLERSVARASDAAVERLKRTVIETAKQCERNVLMDITPEMTLPQLNAFVRGDKFVLHPLKLGCIGQKNIGDIADVRDVTVLVGPEGSFTNDEIETALQFGFQPLQLGARILRTETAAIAVAAAILVHF